eukprot:108775_1
MCGEGREKERKEGRGTVEFLEERDENCTVQDPKNVKQSIPSFSEEGGSVINTFSDPTEKAYCRPPSPDDDCINANIFAQHEMASGESSDRLECVVEMPCDIEPKELGEAEQVIMTTDIANNRQTDKQVVRAEEVIMPSGAESQNTEELQAAQVAEDMPPPKKKKSKQKQKLKAGKRKKPSMPSRKRNSVPVFEPPGVALDKDPDVSAPQLQFSLDQLTVTGGRGWCMAKATHAIRPGTWYYEAVVLPPKGPWKSGNYRLGWSAKMGEMHGPVGYDSYSYAYRDLQGSAVHESTRNDIYGEPYGPTDVIGMYIHMDRIYPLEGSGHELTEEAPDTHVVRFFKNGVDQGIAFKNVKSQPYFPTVSVYQGGAVRVNFGPHFIFPPTGYNPSAAAVAKASPFRGHHKPAPPILPVSNLKEMSAEYVEANILWVKAERDAIKCHQHEQHQEAVATATVEEEPHKEESGCMRGTCA